ncbi:glycosyl hydrolase 108 family protein [Gluconacetobacter sp.]|uniref:glycosyl hydrolase 108 family protein n=1 Tax=Gluconacetobacter sp. TaxID=1935994 RepID=UPI0039E8649E
MQSNFTTITDGTEAREGKYSGRRDDPGNWTGGCVGHGMLVGSMRGISAPTMVRWLHGDVRAVTVATMQAVTPELYRTIAAAFYWRPLSCQKLPAGIDAMVFDFGFNSGVQRSARLLQAAIGLTGDDVDGDIGPQTLRVLAGLKPIAMDEFSSWASALIGKLSVCQEAEYRSFRDFRVNGKGWLARLEWRRQLALSLAQAPGAALAP